MNKIFKYEIPVLEKFTLQLPKNAQIIRVSDVYGKFFLWAIVDVDAELEDVNFAAYKTGQPIDVDLSKLEYLGLCCLFIMQQLGLYLFRIKD